MATDTIFTTAFVYCAASCPDTVRFFKPCPEADPQGLIVLGSLAAFILFVGFAVYIYVRHKEHLNGR